MKESDLFLLMRIQKLEIQVHFKFSLFSVGRGKSLAIWEMNLIAIMGRRDDWSLPGVEKCFSAHRQLLNYPGRYYLLCVAKWELNGFKLVVRLHKQWRVEMAGMLWSLWGSSGRLPLPSLYAASANGPRTLATYLQNDHDINLNLLL